MLNHVSLGVRDLGIAAKFYDKLFVPMGISRADGVRDDEIAYATSKTPARLAAFWLYRVDDDAPIAGARTHIAFSVESRSQLDAIGKAAVALDANIVRQAGLHPDISKTYYGMVVKDPYGHTLEFVAVGQ